MRPANCWGLLALGLLALLAARTAGPSARAEGATARASYQATGDGETPEGARAVALERAQQKVEEDLQERFARIGWQPPADRLTADYLLQKGVIQAEGTKEMKVNGEPRYHAVYRVEINDSYLAGLQKTAQEQRMVARHWLLARALAGAVVLLLVVFGYLRLEDATRGYYTRLLRLAAVGVMVLAGLGLWLSWY